MLFLQLQTVTSFYPFRIFRIKPFSLCLLSSYNLQNIVAVAMLVRRFNFQMALGAPQVSQLLLSFPESLPNELLETWFMKLISCL